MAHKLVCLPVRSIRTLSGSGASCEDAFIPCPMRGATTLAGCESCSRLEAITADDQGRADAVVCRPAVPLWARLLERLRGLPRAPVHALVKPGLVCATCDVSPRQLADIMAEHRVDAVPIVDYERCPVGLISRVDLIEDAGLAPPLMQRAITIDQHETVTRAVELMLAEGVQHLVVTDADERVVGVLSAPEVARYMVRRLEQPVARGKAA